MSALSSATEEEQAPEAAEEEISPEEIIGKYKEMRAEIKKMAQKLDELEMEYNEHQLVLNSITTMDPDRKAFRLIGGVLVQQTVKEVLPNVTDHQTMIQQLLNKVGTSLQAKEKECQAWKLKYNIQTQQERELAKANEVEEKSALPSIEE